ncbi:MAG: GNAT family N-acetyltransferase [Oscillospiraceae bacterium]|nr:GNAT family N-acetyltransferase [Oscillospiraceae bacterium]
MKELNTKTLESNRLILRRFLLEDAEGMYNNWATDSECCKFLSWDVHKNIDETKSVIQSWINGYDSGSYNWIVELKDTNEVIGSISAVSVSKKHFTAELGYCYGSKFWGNGYATEALRTVIEYLLKECNFYLIEARHISGNPASGRVMEKAGMHKDAVLRNRRINKYTGERNDSVIYSIKKEEL